MILFCLVYLFSLSRLKAHIFHNHLAGYLYLWNVYLLYNLRSFLIEFFEKDFHYTQKFKNENFSFINHGFYNWLQQVLYPLLRQNSILGKDQESIGLNRIFLVCLVLILILNSYFVTILMKTVVFAFVIRIIVLKLETFSYWRNCL